MVDLVKLEELAKAAREQSADHQKPGVWMRLFGDRFVYTRLEDGCRGRPVVGVDMVRQGDDDVLAFIAFMNPATALELKAELDAKDAEIARLREALRPFADAFVGARDKYSARYGKDKTIGLSNFDKMPDHWSMEQLTFNMGVFRRAAAAYEEPRT